MSVRKQFKVDPVAAVKGAPMKFAPNDDGTVPTIWVARNGPSNPGYQKALNDATTPELRAASEAGALTDEQARPAVAWAMARCLITGWDHYQDDANKDIPFSPEAAHAELMEIPELFAAIDAFAKQISNFREAQKESDAKN